MTKVFVNIGDRTYMCEMPETDEEFRKGLMDRKTLADDCGMLFDFSKRDDASPQMWMKNTTLSLDMIGIDDNGNVIKVVTPEPESEDLIPFEGCKYVLEVNAGSGIEVGDDFEIDDSDDLDKYTMKVLAPDGSTQMLLQGGERIFSRASTKKLIIRAKAAYASRDDAEAYEKNCKKLGVMCFKELKCQDNRPADYVTLPEEHTGENNSQSQ